MTGEELTTNQWLEQNKSHFEQTGQLANRISEQNQIYSDLIGGGRVTVKPFQELATDYLTAEQEQTFMELIETERHTPYEELSERAKSLEAALGEAAAKLSSIEQYQKEEIALIHREGQLLSKALPGLVSKLTELTVQLEHRLLDKARQEAETDVIALQDEYDSLEKMVDISGRSWPIPRLASKKPEKATEEDLIEVDDFPASPIRPTKQQIAERVLKKYPEVVLRDASEFVALLLAEEPKHIFTLEDLGSIIYGDDEPNRRVRISALISNFALGKVGIIGKSLKEDGLVFQRGERRSYRQTDGMKIGRKTPVFRAVPLSEIERKERVVHCDEEEVEWVNDGWHTVVFEPTQENIEDNSVSLEATPELTDDKKPEIAEEPEIQLSLPSTYDETAVVEHAIVVEPKFQPVKSPLPVPTRKEVAKRKEPEWKTNFRKSVLETITHFEADGLMIEGEISWSIVATKSSSRIMGTTTMADRAVLNGIISRHERQNESTLPLAKFICMALLPS